MSKNLVLEMDYETTNPCARSFNECFCNWGVRKTPFDGAGNIKGKTAPLWINPCPKLFIASFVMCLFTTLIFLASFVVIQHHPYLFDESTKETFSSLDIDDPFIPYKDAKKFTFFVIGTIILFVNTFNFLALYSKEYASDEEWFRYFILTIIFTVGMLAIFVCDIIFTIKNYNKYDKIKKLGTDDYYLAYVILSIFYIAFNFITFILDLIIHLLIYKNYVFAKFVPHTASCEDEDIVVMEAI